MENFRIRIRACSVHTANQIIQNNIIRGSKSSIKFPRKKRKHLIGTAAGGFFFYYYVIIITLAVTERIVFNRLHIPGGQYAPYCNDQTKNHCNTYSSISVHTQKTTERRT